MSAGELIAAVRVHLDRVHDSVLRLGCGPGPAVSVVECTALELVERAADSADTMPELIGWWFARAREAGLEVAGNVAHDRLPGGTAHAGDGEQRRLAEALSCLPALPRTALVLHDSYALPAAAVGAALDTDDDTALAVVGQARLELAAHLEGGPARVVADHQADPAALTRLAGTGSGRPSPGTASRDATARRHALSCPSCGPVTDAQRRMRDRIAGLTVRPVPQLEREPVLERVEQAAGALLPSESDLLGAGVLFTDDVVRRQRRRTLSPVLVCLGLVLAVGAGLAIGLLLLDEGPQDTRAARDEQLRSLPSRQPAPAQVLVSPPVVQPPDPSTSVFLLAPPSTPAEELPPQEELPLEVKPSTGGNGAELFVTGTGWAPGATVTLLYLGVDGRETGSRAVERVDAGGRFGLDLLAEDPTDRPGRHTVRVSDGTRTLEAPYDAVE